MELRNATLSDWQNATERVSFQSYGGNLVVHTNSEQGNKSARVRLDVRSSYGPGARRSHSGRRLRAACWHAHRDVIAALFDAKPGAVLKSGLRGSVSYDGRDDFRSKFPATGHVNVGSQVEPLAYKHACDCAS